MARALLRERTDEPLTGWRVWKLRIEPSGSLVLAPAVYGTEGWSPRSAAAAACRRHRHDAPVERCRCGLHALREVRGLRRLRWTGTVVGTVSLWGRVVEHARGYRSQYAYPQRLKLVCARCLRNGRVSSAECVTMLAVPPKAGRAADEVVAACARHAGTRRAAPLDLSPRQVEASLLSAYAVDVLPSTSLGAAQGRLAGLPLWLAASIRIGERMGPLLLVMLLLYRLALLGIDRAPPLTAGSVDKPISPRELIALGTASTPPRHLSMEAMRLVRTECHDPDPGNVDPRCEQIKVVASSTGGTEPECPDSRNMARLMLCFHRLAREFAEAP